MKCFFLLEVNKPIKKIRIPINKRGIPIIAPIRVIVRTKPTTITIKPVKIGSCFLSDFVYYLFKDLAGIFQAIA